MRVHEIAPGCWRWTGNHPDWTPEDGGPEGWEQEVGCVYYEAADTVVLIDPLVPPEEPERFWTALDSDVERAARPLAVLLTVYWHGRSSAAVLERYEDATLWVGARSAAELGDRVTNPFRAEDRLPGGLHAFEATDELVFWIPEHRTIVPGDVLLGGTGDGVRLCPESWVSERGGHEGLRKALRPLLELPVERILVTHGEPVLEGGHEALARALDAQELVSD